MNKFQAFFVNLNQDERLPKRDKSILMGMAGIVLIAPIIIPGWISEVGFVVSLMLLGTIGDYFFNYVDQRVLLSHYPWGMKSFTSIQRFARFLAIVAPSFITNQIWEYKRDIY